VKVEKRFVQQFINNKSTDNN